MPMSFFAPLRPSAKHESLANQAPLPRGAEAKAKVEATHAGAENRYVSNLVSKVESAAKHNQKAASVATGAKWADVLVSAERKVNVDKNMQEHEARRDAQLKLKAGKGTDEVNKVATAVAALQDAAVVSAKAHVTTMNEATARRQEALGRIAAKGAAQSAKVERSAEAFEAECELRAQQLTERLDAAAEAKELLAAEPVAKAKAKQEGATARLEAQKEELLAKGLADASREAAAATSREQHLEAVALKGAKEAHKVAQVQVKLQEESEAKLAKLNERLAAAEARKAGVSYPPCARPPKVAAVVPRRVGPLRKMALAIGATVFARGLVILGAKLGGIRSLFSFGAKLVTKRK